MLRELAIGRQKRHQDPGKGTEKSPKSRTQDPNCYPAVEAPPAGESPPTPRFPRPEAAFGVGFTAAPTASATPDSTRYDAAPGLVFSVSPMLCPPVALVNLTSVM